MVIKHAAHMESGFSFIVISIFGFRFNYKKWLCKCKWLCFWNLICVRLESFKSMSCALFKWIVQTEYSFTLVLNWNSAEIRNVNIYCYFSESMSKKVFFSLYSFFLFSLSYFLVKIVSFKSKIYSFFRQLRSPAENLLC